MMWPLGKKFDLWVHADRSAVLELLSDPESFSGQHAIAFFESATVIGNLVVVPARIHTGFAREIWAKLSQSGEGVRARGRYGLWLSMQNILFIMFIFFAIALAMGGDSHWIEMALGAAIIIGFDRISRPFARMRYDDFLLFLKMVSGDGDIHAAGGRG